VRPHACRRGDDAGARRHAQKSGNGHRSVVALLLAHGGDATIVTADGDSALHASCRQGDEELCALLLDAGGDGDAPGVAGLSAFDVASAAGHGAMVHRLRQLARRHRAAAAAARAEERRSHSDNAEAADHVDGAHRRDPARPSSNDVSLPALDEPGARGRALDSEARHRATSPSPLRRSASTAPLPTGAASLGVASQGAPLSPAPGASRPSPGTPLAASSSAPRVSASTAAPSALATLKPTAKPARQPRKFTIPMPGDDMDGDVAAPSAEAPPARAPAAGFLTLQMDALQRFLREEKAAHTAEKRRCEAARAQAAQLLGDLLQSQGAVARLRDERARLTAELRHARGHDLDGQAAPALASLEADVAAAGRRIARHREAQLRASRALPDAYACPITRELMEDPVFCSDGHTYERRAISQWLAHHETSPKTGLALDHKHLTPNFAIRSAIDEHRSRELEAGADEETPPKAHPRRAPPLRH